MHYDFRNATTGNIFSIIATNASAAVKYVRLYNKASAPTVGTDIALITIVIPATFSKKIVYDIGFKFGTGIAFAITGGAAATDATAVAAGDVQLLINWQ